MTVFEATYRDGAFHPTNRFHNVVAAEFGEGELVRLERHEERSGKSHNHFFASLQDAWANLGEDAAERFPTSEHLRKWALIKAGYRDERTIACSSKAEARRVAAFIKPMDEYALVVVSEALVSVYTAQSQKMKAMGRARFQQSKTDVLGLLATLLGVEPEQFGRAA